MSDPGFRYLNLENAWPDFTLHGLVRRADGAITLAQVPLAEEVIGSAGAVAGLTGPAGIGVDDEGRLYIADPTGHRVLRWDPCGEIQALPCFGGEGSMPGQLRTPRAVIVGPRDALYVADSGNHRVQVIDLHTLQLRGIWGQPEPYREPAPGDAPNRLNEPWDLAADAAGGIYVLDHGNQRVLKFDADGRVIPAFWETLRDQKPVLLEPIAIATMLIDGQERLIVLDLGLRRVLVVDLDGHLDDSATERWQALLIGDQAAVEPVALAASTEAVYVGDAASGRVLVFDREGHFLGLAQGYQGPLAGLSLDRRGRLLVHTGGAGVVVMRPGRAYVGEGTFVAGPFSAGGQHTAWQQLRVQADPLPPTAHLQLYTYASDDPIPRPDLRAPAARTTIWRPAAPGALAIWLDHPPARYLWIGGVLTGDLDSAPILRQMRLEYDQETWLRHLPAIYARDEAGRGFLERALSLFAGTLADAAALIDDLPRLFDPSAAADQPPSLWLDWLAGWLAFELDSNWTDVRRRQAVADAFAMHGRRGTVEGLRHFIELYTGVQAHITESAAAISLWVLGEQTALGFDTMLAPVHPQGAVLGATATLDQAHLLAEGQDWVPLFAEIAHHFCVRLYAADIADPRVVERVRQVVEQEKPAHTTYHLCLIEPRMQVGLQAQLGVDSIVGGPPHDLVAGEPRRLGFDTMLPGANHRDGAGATFGEDAWVGIGTRLG